MNSKIILILAATLFWSSGSWWWYTCKIKGQCSSEQTLASHDTHNESFDTSPNMVAKNITDETNDLSLDVDVNEAMPSVFNDQAAAQKATAEIYTKPLDSNTLAKTNIEQLTYDLFNSPLNNQDADQQSTPINIATTENTESITLSEPAMPEVMTDNKQASVGDAVIQQSETAEITETTHQTTTNNVVAITVDLSEPEEVADKADNTEDETETPNTIVTTQIEQNTYTAPEMDDEEIPDTIVADSITKHDEDKTEIPDTIVAGNVEQNTYTAPEMDDAEAPDATVTAQVEQNTDTITQHNDAETLDNTVAENLDSPSSNPSNNPNPVDTARPETKVAAATNIAPDQTLINPDIPNVTTTHNAIESNNSSNSNAPQISLASLRSSTDVLRNTLDRERAKQPPKRIISFTSNSAEFNKNRANRAYLNQLTDWLINDMSNNVTIIGYTDNKGEQANNVLLGLIRASNVKKELIRLGAPQYSVRIESQGNLKPIASNDTVIGRKQNRRVEIVPSAF